MKQADRLNSGLAPRLHPLASHTQRGLPGDETNSLTSLVPLPEHDHVSLFPASLRLPALLQGPRRHEESDGAAGLRLLYDVLGLLVRVTEDVLTVY